MARLSLLDERARPNPADTPIGCDFMGEGFPLSTQYRSPMNVTDSLSKLQNLDGFLGAALVDSESGMTLGMLGGGPLNLEIASAGNTEVVRSKRKTMKNLGIRDEIEDILITLTKQYHIIRPMRGRPTVFFYAALDRSHANLAMARMAIADVEKDLVL